MITTEKVGRCPSSGAVLPPFGLSPQAVSVLRTAATIARGLLLAAFLFLIIFALPALFGGL